MKRIACIENVFSSFVDMDQITKKHDSTLNWMWNKGIIPKQKNCCNKPMRKWTFIFGNARCVNLHIQAETGYGFNFMRKPQ